MLTANTGLPDHVLAEIADLERRVVAVDGGRLKLGWSSLRSRTVDEVLVYEGGRLVGFLGVYRHGAVPELAGMIDPAFRRQGFGTAALVRGLELVRDTPSVLLVVPRASSGGRRLALGRGGVLDHSEHALVQRVAPDSVRDVNGLRIRPADEADRDIVGRLLEDGFGEIGGAGNRLEHTMVAELDGRPVATLVVEQQHERADVYGFVVTPPLRARGIGRAVLGRVSRQLHAGGMREVGLEVEVRNDRALGLYTSLGFEPLTTEDYYRLATPAAGRRQTFAPHCRT